MARAQPIDAIMAAIDRFVDRIQDYDAKNAAYQCLAGNLRRRIQRHKRTRFPHQGTRWTDEDRAALMEEFSEGTLTSPDEDVVQAACERIGRDEGACRYELHRLLERDCGTNHALARQYGCTTRDILAAKMPLHRTKK